MPSSMSRLEQQRGGHDEQGVEDDQHEEPGDQPAVRPGVASRIRATVPGASCWSRDAAVAGECTRAVDQAELRQHPRRSLRSSRPAGARSRPPAAGWNVASRPRLPGRGLAGDRPEAARSAALLVGPAPPGCAPRPASSAWSRGRRRAGFARTASRGRRPPPRGRPAGRRLARPIRSASAASDRARRQRRSPRPGRLPPRRPASRCRSGRARGPAPARFIANLTSPAATRTSHASASWKPAPMAEPWTAATLTIGTLARRPDEAVLVARRWSRRDRLGSRPASGGGRPPRDAGGGEGTQVDACRERRCPRPYDDHVGVLAGPDARCGQCAPGGRASVRCADRAVA